MHFSRNATLLMGKERRLKVSCNLEKCKVSQNFWLLVSYNMEILLFFNASYYLVLDKQMCERVFLMSACVSDIWF